MTTKRFPGVMTLDECLRVVHELDQEIVGYQSEIEMKTFLGETKDLAYQRERLKNLIAAKQLIVNTWGEASDETL